MGPRTMAARPREIARFAFENLAFDAPLDLRRGDGRFRCESAEG
jgi:hypothetical protein